MKIKHLRMIFKFLSFNKMNNLSITCKQFNSQIRIKIKKKQLIAEHQNSRNKFKDFRLLQRRNKYLNTINKESTIMKTKKSYKCYLFISYKNQI